jgi:hypothetical protein
MSRLEDTIAALEKSDEDKEQIMKKHERNIQGL